MGLIYLVRHAECIGNVEKRLTGLQDYELTERGKEQAQRLQEKLKNVKFENIYSSPFRRTINTAKPIAELQKIEIKTHNELSEMKFGNYDGYTWEEVDKLDRNILHNSKKEIIGIPKQETTKHVQERMMKIITQLAEENSNQTILICSHGISIEAFLRDIQQIPFYVENKKCVQNNAAINIVEYRNQKFKIIKMGDIKYLNN